MRFDNGVFKVCACQYDALFYLTFDASSQRHFLNTPNALGDSFSEGGEEGGCV